MHIYSPTDKRDIYSKFNSIYNEDLFIIDSKEDIAPSILRKEIRNISLPFKKKSKLKGIYEKSLIPFVHSGFN